jgi:hypothetical protein
MNPENTIEQRTAHGFCTRCGTGLMGEERFCAGCGRQVAPSPSPASSAQATSAASVPSEPPPLSQQPGPDTIGAFGFDLGKDEATPGGRRRWMVATAAGTTVLLIVGILAVVMYQRQQETPILAALDDANAAFSPALAVAESSRDLADVKAAGKAMGASLPTLVAAQESLTGLDGELAGAALGVVSAQVDIAEDVAPMAELTDQDVSGWGAAYEDLVGDVDALTDSRNGLEAVDGDRAAGIETGELMLANLERVMGNVVTESADSALGVLFRGLSDAKTTADVRAIAEEAAQNRSTVQAALPGVKPDSADAAHLQAAVDVYAALASLGTLDAGHLDDWASVRAELVASLGALPAQSSLQPTGSTAIDEVNDLVFRGEKRLADWQVDYDAAVDAKAADGAAFRGYRDSMNTQLQRYSSLRSDLAGWIDRVESGAYVTYDEAYTVLSQAQADRQVVRDAIGALTPPASVVAAHTDLLTVIDDAIAATQAGYDGVLDSDYCGTSCYYADTPGWQRFSTESPRITTAFSDAVGAWESALAEAEASIENRTLPTKPIV